MHEAVKSSGTLDLVNIDREDMESRMITDIKAWKDSLTLVLMSIKQHADASEKQLVSQQKKPYTLKFRDENAITKESRSVEIYRLNTTLPFKKSLDVDKSLNEGIINKWRTGRDFLLAIKSFISIGDIYVHGDFLDCNDYVANITEHTYKKDNNIPEQSYGRLFISLQELKE